MQFFLLYANKFTTDRKHYLFLLYEFLYLKYNSQYSSQSKRKNIMYILSLSFEKLQKIQMQIDSFERQL
jgi:hypothetical protein